ncbi:MarC family protein [Treponema primitia]|uniref:MarC family protein n=1 Tax=Treponema primitia TaxID=88058 RepID=UPI00025557B4|nr:MarC family protein [Treponema primitia]
MVRDFLQILFTVLLVMDPIGIIPQFISFTAGLDKKDRNSIITKSVLIASIVILIFLLAGKFLLLFFGIMPGSFYISGGILFFLISFEMIYNKPGTRKMPDDDSHGTYIALFPLAIPLIAGPGLLTVIMVFMTNGHSWLYSFTLLFPAVIIGLLCTYLSLRGSLLILKLLGTMGIFVLEKIMGLILAGFAVQFIYNGLTALGILKGP